MDFSQRKRKIKKRHKLNTRETQIQSEYIKMKLSTRMQTNNIYVHIYQYNAYTGMGVISSLFNCNLISW